MAIPTGSYDKRKIDIILSSGGKFVLLPLASGRHRATYLAEYYRVGKITHHFQDFGAGDRLPRKAR
jgi:hypothetical protein